MSALEDMHANILAILGGGRAGSKTDWAAGYLAALPLRDALALTRVWLAPAGFVVEQDWQPIKTAPVTGEFLVWANGSAWLVHREDWNGGADMGFPKDNGCGCCSQTITNATHWRSLPTPPAAAKEPQA